MHLYKCDKKNNTSNCIREKVLETLVKSTREVGNMIYLFDIKEGDSIHNMAMDKQRIIVGKIYVEIEEIFA